ncbi:MAG: hypothetical protein CL868_08535 [Cytophagaceae bacterium]|nr:hypothetical protein [Cytophagaceae bacterium]|tara:strand:+ start:47 stop:1264 length:1218 start_codon:yes stop_codon:yes gene_type:complete
MNSNYKKLGDYIQPVNRRNTDLKVETLLGVSIQKILMPSIANTLGTNMKTYKIIEKNQFAYGPVTSRNGDKISIALLQEFDEAIISQAYTVFEVVDTKKLHHEYLMMWFCRPEFDRYARFKSHGSARETFDWDELCEVELPIPSIEKQREIVNEYNTVTDRIKLNEQLCQKLEETAQALYKHWFVDFEFPNEEGEPYKSSGGEMVYKEELDKEIPEGWEVKSFNEIAKLTMGQSPKGDSYNDYGIGIPLINGPVEFGDYFTVKTKWTTSPKKYCKDGDLILCVRGSTVGRFVISDGKYAIGRGVTAISSINQNFIEFLIKVNLSEILKDVTGSTFPNLDRKTIENYRIPLSKEKVIEAFDKLLSPLKSLIKQRAKMNIHLTKFQAVLLSKISTVKENVKLETIEN